MAITYTQTIEAPIEQVFDCVDNNEKVKIWAEGVEEIVPGEPYDPEDPVGSRFTQRIREGGRVAEYQGEVTAYDKPQHMAIKMGNAMFEIHVDYRFTALSETTTHMDYQADITYKALIARLMGMLFGWLTKRILNKQMAAFKALAESSD